MDIEFKEDDVVIIVLQEALSSDCEVTDDIRKYISDFKCNLDKYREYVASELLNLYNQTWFDERIGILSKQEFALKLINPSIHIYDQMGYAVIYFDNLDIFGGHCIEVSVQNGTATDASLAG